MDLDLRSCPPPRLPRPHRRKRLIFRWFRHVHIDILSSIDIKSGRRCPRDEIDTKMARLIVKHSSAILVLICGALLGIGIVADFLWASSSRFNISYPHWVADKTILIAPDLTPPSKCGVGRRAVGSSGGLGRSLVKSSQPVVTPCGDVMGVVRDKGIFVIFTKKSAHVIPQFGRQKPLLGFVGTGLEEMIRLGVELSRTVARTARPFPICRAPSLISRPSPSRLLHDHINASTASPVALQMIDYALSLARSHKSDESYAQGMLVLEQCLSTQSSENSSGMVLLAMSTLLSERGNIDEAIEKLRIIQDFSSSSLSVRVAASEALVGLHLELGLDDSSSVFADRCLELLEKYQPDDDIGGSEVIYARAKAVKGLVELVHGKLESAESFFQGSEADKGYTGSIALSYGEILHATQKFQPAKVLYQKVIQELAEDKDFSGPHTLAACNMSSKEVSIAATCALGQLEAHLGNFGDAEQILTRALTETEEQFGSHHPKVGVILTCIALMFRRKAIQERSSSLLIQEGLYRKAIELLKAPLETEEVEVNRKDIVALAKGGYAEALCVQQNRKSEGEKMKRWAEAAWKNRRLSLAEALEISEVSSKVPVVDARISRAL